MNSIKKLRIVVLAPNPTTAIEIANFLEAKLGVNRVSTYQAYNAVQGKEICEQMSPHLVIIDSAIIGAGGYDMARLLPDKKIIFASDVDDFSSRRREFKNVIAVIEKPVDDELLLKIIKKEFHIE